MTTKLSWRLSKLPTPDEVRELVKDKIITQDEAREILFSGSEERDAESLQAEIKFLRALVDKLSTNRSVIVETIREVSRPWQPCQWYQPYQIWCSNATTLTNTALGTTMASSSLNTVPNAGSGGLSSVQTF